MNAIPATERRGFMPAAADEIEIWHVDLAAPEPVDAACLSGDEQARAAGFVAELHRRRFVAGRAALRRILGARLRSDPADLVFDYGPWGKPELAAKHGREQVTFNVAHSADLMLCAVGRGRRLGIDVERQPQDIDFLGIARLHFSACEVAALSRLKAEDRARGFNACWTRKEACIKATGLGLSAPLRGFSVPVMPGMPRSEIVAPDVAGTCRLTLEAFAPAPGFAAAIAAEGADWRLVHLGHRAAHAALLA